MSLTNLEKFHKVSWLRSLVSHARPTDRPRCYEVNFFFKKLEQSTTYLAREGGMGVWGREKSDKFLTRPIGFCHTGNWTPAQYKSQPITGHNLSVGQQWFENKTYQHKSSRRLFSLAVSSDVINHLKNYRK